MTPHSKVQLGSSTSPRAPPFLGPECHDRGGCRVPRTWKLPAMLFFFFDCTPVLVVACGIFLDEDRIRCPLHWQVNS